MINSVLILNFAKFTTDFAVVSFIMFWVLCFLTPIMFDQKHLLLKNDICIKRSAKNGVWQHSYKKIFQCKLSSDALEFNSEIKLSSSSCKILVTHVKRVCHDKMSSHAFSKRHYFEISRWHPCRKGRRECNLFLPRPYP